MTDWSLSVLLAGLHDEIERKLEIVRKSFGHSGTKGDASEKVWLELLQTYLPRRYQAAKAHVVDSKGVFSDQIDVVSSTGNTHRSFFSMRTRRSSQRKACTARSKQSRRSTRVRWPMRRRRSPACAVYIAQASPFRMREVRTSRRRLLRFSAES